MPIKVEIELDTGRLESGIVRANTQLRQFQNATSDTITSIRRIDGESKSFLSTIRDVTVILGQAGFAMENLHRISTGWVGEIVKLNAEVERMSALLKAMSTATDPVKEASDYIKNLREEAKQAPFSLQAMHQAFIRMKSGGLDPAAGSMKALVDAVAAFGGTDETLGRASLAFQEMSGKGVVQMKELRNQLGMAIPQAMNLMARSFGVTYQQLMEDVHTGTVVAKDAIEALNLEFERVYGGAAQRQMETFNGQLARMKVIMMDLAIKAGGADSEGNELENGFFGTLKKQFKEFNDMMTGSTGQVLAGELGAGLTQMVLMLRQAVDAAIEFRGVIIAGAQALAAGFAGQAIIFGFSSLKAAIVGVAEQLALMRNQWTLVKENFMAGNMVATRTGMFVALGASLTALAGVLPMVVGGLALVAQYFDIAGSKAKDALEEIKKFGAMSQDQVDKARENPAQLQAKFDRLLRLKESGASVAPSINAEMERLAEEIRKANEVIDKGQVDVNREQARRATMAMTDRLNDEIAAIRRRYFEEGNIAAEAYRKEVADYNQSRKSTADIQKKYQEENRERAKRQYDQQLELLDRNIAAQQELFAKGNEQEAAAAEQAIKELNRRRDEQIELRRKEVERGMGTSKENKALKDDALFKRGEKYIEKLKAEIEGAKAGILGLDSDVYALKERLNDPNFVGDMGIEKFRQMGEEMTALKQQAEDFQKISNAKKQWDTDFENVYVKSRQDLMEAQAKARGEEASDLDKLLEKRRSGFYAGFGDAFTEEQKRLKTMRESVERIGEAAKTTGELIRGELFSQPTTTAAETFTSAMNKAAESILKLGDAAKGIPLIQMLGSGNGSPFAGLSSPQTSAADNYYSRLYGRESSGNPNAQNPNSTATGLGQFLESTWMDFLQKAHPEMMNLRREEALALRSNIEMSKEATRWLAQSNGDKLIKSGFQATDANVYMAHFLGIGDAMKVLGASNDRLVSTLVSSKVLNANQSVLGGGKTVGQFKSELEGKFGNEMSWLDGIVDPSQRTQYAQIRQNEAATKAKNIQTATANYIQGLKDIAESAKIIEEGANKNLAKAVKYIRERKDGGSTNPDAPEYSNLLAEARRADAEEARKLLATKARTSASSAQSAMADALSKSKIAEQEAYQNFLLDPQELKANQAYVRAKAAGEERLGRMRGQYDEETVAAEEMKLQEQLTAVMNEEVFKQIGATRLKDQEIRRSLMTESEARQDAYNKEIDRIQNLVASFQGGEEQKKQIVEQSETYMATLRAQLAQSTPLGRQLKEMANFSDNFERTVGNGLNAVIDNFSSMMVGMKVNWKNTLQSMAKDFAAFALRGLLGNLLGFGNAQMGGLSSIFGNMKPLFHTGGIVGADFAGARNVPISAWAGAPRFHEGGMIGPGEVPIIAKKGEGVFTQQQMAALGAGVGQAGTNISMPITVNASGGTPEQNRDLAGQVGRQVETIARGVVADEIRRQSRPGGMIATKFGR